MTDKLTGREEKFAACIADGMSPSAAYRAAGYKSDVMCNDDIAAQAWKIQRKPNVTTRINQLKEISEKASIWTRIGTLEMLKNVADTALKAVETGLEAPKPIYNHNAANTALKAAEQAAKMCGFNEPERVEASVKIELSSEIDEIAK